MDFGERLKTIRKLKGLTLDDVGRALGVTRQAIAKYEHGTVSGGVPLERIEQLAAVLDCSVYDLTGWERRRSRTVPRYGFASCGFGVVPQQSIVDNDNLPSGVNADFSVTVRGDSMSDVGINDGDTVFIKAQPTADSGAIVLALISGVDDCAVIKRIKFTDGGVILQSENADYAPMVFTGDDVNNVKIMGIATGLSRVIS